MKFTSRDRDNDLWSDGNCERHEGGWWHRSCSNIYLNAAYNHILIILNDQFHYPKFLEMKIRPKIVTLSNEDTSHYYVCSYDHASMSLHVSISISLILLL